MRKPWYKKFWIWGVVVIIIVIASTGGKKEVEDIKPAEDSAAIDNPSNPESEDEQEKELETVNAEKETEADKAEEEEAIEEVVEKSPKEEMLAQVMGLIDEGLAFDTGNYVKGEVPKGEYAFISFDGSGKYYSEEDSAGNIIDNENFDSFGYVYVHGSANLTTQGALISVNAFEEIDVSGAKEIYELLNEVEAYQESGMYKVGTDISASEYIIESIGESYVAVLSGPVGNNDIVNNENFNGKYSVNVTDGQYLQISRGVILD